MRGIIKKYREYRGRKYIEVLHIVCSAEYSKHDMYNCIDRLCKRLGIKYCIFANTIGIKFKYKYIIVELESENEAKSGYTEYHISGRWVSYYTSVLKPKECFKVLFGVEGSQERYVLPVGEEMDL